MHQQIQQKIESDSTVDVEYWESLLKRLIVYKAKAQLREIHESLKQKAAQFFNIAPMKIDWNINYMSEERKVFAIDRLTYAVLNKAVNFGIGNIKKEMMSQQEPDFGF